MLELQFIDLYFGFSLLGVVLGLGAAIIILILGVASLKSHYWFHILNGVDRFTIRFMLWPGAILLLLASYVASLTDGLEVSYLVKLGLTLVILLNGSYLTFVFAPVIRELENDGKTTFLSLPMPHQVLIFVAGSIAGICWGAQAFILWFEIINLAG